MSDLKKGFVHLAGAGPGDPDLISVKAVEALREADCVIYDFLANSRFVEGLDCEKIYVGKQGGDHTLPQDEINELIVRKALEGKRVVRLKGGDPFIFGRGGEEAEILVKNGIPFSIIPGISSFYSAPAYAGIPLTHRDYADSFEVVTGHRKADASEEEDIHFPRYEPHKTYAFLMGMKNLAYISRRLIGDYGFPPAVSSAVVSWGTTPRQRAVTAPLEDLARRAAEEGVGAPAIIVVGEVVRLRETLRWFDTLPLFGRKIVVTRTREQSSALTRRLLALGASVVEYPTIEIRERGDVPELAEALGHLGRYQWIVFTSQNAVKIFFRRLKEAGKDARALHGCRIAAIGPATARELEDYCLTADLVPDEYVAEALLAEMAREPLKGAAVLLPCASEARMTLTEGLEREGALVERIPLYDTVAPSPTREESEAVRGADIITFTSSSTARNFFGLVKETGARLACIGPITAEEVRRQGYEPHIVADVYTIEGLVDALLGSQK